MSVKIQTNARKRLIVSRILLKNCPGAQAENMCISRADGVNCRNIQRFGERQRGWLCGPAGPDTIVRQETTAVKQNLSKK